MLNSTPNKVVVAEQQSGQRPQHQGEYGPDAMDRGFVESFHSEAVEAAEVFEAAEDALREGQRRILKPEKQFSVVVWREFGKAFPANIGSFYVGQIVCATGVVELDEGSPVIIATTQDQLVDGC